MTVLAIDQGTSATKAVVFCPERGVLADVDVPVPGGRFAGDAVEQDPEALWQSVVDAGTRALAAAGEPVEAVGVGNQGETVLGWDRASGAPLTMAVSWQDRRAVSVTDRLRAEGWADRLVGLSGLPLDPYFAAPKQSWVQATLLDQGSAPATAVVSTVDAFVLHRLTGGAYVTDATTASRTGVLDLDAGAWHADACAAYGLDPRRLPEVVSCDETLGVTEAFGPRLPVVGAMVDQQAALLAQGCRDRGEAKCTYGTGAFVLAALGERPTRSTAGLATSIAARLRDGVTRYCADGQVYSVGAAVRWLERVGLVDGPEDLDRLGLAEADSGGVAFVPSLAGLGAPVWRPQARGAFVGLSLATTRGQLLRAVGEGVAAQVTLLARAVEADLGAPLSALRVDGGLTRSRLVMQAQADLLGAPVEVYPQACATALGVAALTLRGVHGAGAEDVVVRGWTPSAVFEPTADRSTAEGVYDRWERALRASLDEPDRG